MKFFFLCGMLLLLGCNDAEKCIAIHETVPSNKNLIRGSWVNISYINRLRETHSVVSSYGNLIGLSSFNLDFDATSKYTTIHYSYNNHEGFDMDVSVKKYNDSLIILESIPPFSFADVDKIILKVNLYSEIITGEFYQKSVLNSKIVYEKVDEEFNDDLDYGVKQITNKILFEGKYNDINNNNEDTICFFLNGQLKGLKNGYTNYQIITDYVEAEDSIKDMISFFDSEGGSQLYGYKISSDTVTLIKLGKPQKSEIIVLKKYCR